MRPPEFTIGIEEEYQIIDPETRELRSYVQEFLEQGRQVLKDQIKAEQLQSQIEVGSKICRSMAEAREDVARLRRTVRDVAAANGLVIAAASTHPFSSWMEQDVTPMERYLKAQAEMAELARRLLIFGMHVHIGFDDRELLIDVMDQARYFLPHLLALSTSSPFWHGRQTGLKSYRSIVFEAIPRSGPPPEFASWAEHQEFIAILVKTRCIEDASRVWWDIRPHPRYPTLEFRVCDICTRLDEAMCLAAVTAALVAKLVQLRQENQSWRRYRHHLIRENKWRAVRYGVEGKLLDFGRQQEIPFRDLVEEFLAFVDDVLDPMGLRSDVEYARTICAQGTSADRQLATFRRTGSLEAVVDQLVAETTEGL